MLLKSSTDSKHCYDVQRCPWSLGDQPGIGQNIASFPTAPALREARFLPLNHPKNVCRGHLRPFPPLLLLPSPALALSIANRSFALFTHSLSCSGVTVALQSQRQRIFIKVGIHVAAEQTTGDAGAALYYIPLWPLRLIISSAVYSVKRLPFVQTEQRLTCSMAGDAVLPGATSKGCDVKWYGSPEPSPSQRNTNQPGPKVGHSKM